MRGKTIVAVSAALFLALPACSAQTAAKPAADSRGPLHATLTTPTDIDLSWTDERPGVEGHLLEFATDEAGPYTPLQYLARQTTTYRHPDLLPQTTFLYRLHSYGGPATPSVAVDLPEQDSTEELTDQDWLSPVDRPGHQGERHSLRTSDAGAPTALHAEVKDAGGIHFTWTDNSTDEDGFLLEIRRRPGDAFEPVMVMDPDVDSAGLITLAGEKHASYRVRAYVLGERSNVVRLRTGGEV
ncbi:fibronectin type III domain-containing protein [Streptomyces sp. NPDC088387]|uniref:fibronectin type III domain-containing protein n=1 Tax=Streptomyces sp. NPDC088387 TaxID=3365859 RepID=UPI00380C8A03